MYTHTTIYINYHLSNAGFPPWHHFWVMKRVGKVRNPNSFGHDLFSFPLITKQLLTDSQHSQHSHSVFLAFQTCRQTGWERREVKSGKEKTKWKAKGRERVCGRGRVSLCSLLFKKYGGSQSLIVLGADIWPKGHESLNRIGKSGQWKWISEVLQWQYKSLSSHYGQQLFKSKWQSRSFCSAYQLKMTVFVWP